MADEVVEQEVKAQEAPEAEVTVTEEAGKEAKKPEGETAKPDEVKKPEKTAEQKRIDQLWKEAKIAKERAARLEAELQKRKDTPSPVAIVRPKRDSFDTDDAFMDAVDKYNDQRLEQKLKESKEKEASDRTAAEQSKAWEGFDDAAGKLDTEQYSDFTDILAESQKMEWSGLQTEYIRTSKVGPQILYHLAKNPELQERIAHMPIDEQTEAMIEIKRQVVKASDTRKITKTSPPINPVGGTKGTIDKKLEDMTDDEFNATRRKQVLAKKIGRI